MKFIKIIKKILFPLLLIPTLVFADTTDLRTKANEVGSTAGTRIQVKEGFEEVADLFDGGALTGSALSVIGRATNSSGDTASIAAASDHQVLRRSGTSLAFGAVNLAQSAAVTGILPYANLPALSVVGLDTAGGLISTTSTSLVAVTDISIVINVPANSNVIVNFIAAISHSAAGQVIVDVAEDGTPVGAAMSVRPPTGTNGETGFIAQRWIFGPSAGNHTYTAQWRVASGTGYMLRKTMTIETLRIS